jgi:hypothetical protein
MSSFFNLIDTISLDRKLETGEYPFSEKVFFKKNLALLNLTFNQNQIIETILTVGILEDFYVLLKLYNKVEITAAIKSSVVLDKKTANFCHLYFNIPKEDICVSQNLDYSNYHLSIYSSFNLFKGL